MKKLKVLLSSLAISLGMFTTQLFGVSGIVNVPVVHEAWTFIGVPGFQTFGASTSTTVTWPTTSSATTPIIIDAAGQIGANDYKVSGLEVPTWDGNFSGTEYNTTNALAGAWDDGSTGTPRAASIGAGVGNQIYGAVAIMAIGQETTGALSTATDHDGATIAAMAWTPKAHEQEAAIRTMYIKSPDAVYPDIKVMYQANYEGQTYNVQFETGSATALTSTDNNTYLVTFNHNYTYDAAGVLGVDFPLNNASSSSSGGNLVSGVLASFDMNLSDNNVTSDAANIEPNTAAGTFNSLSYPNSLRGTLDGNLTVLTWDSATQDWDVFRATGDGSTVTVNAANDFNSFEQGRGYWVKLERDGGQVVANPAAFILSHNTANDINHSSYIADGWNMLSFNDAYLSYSTTGMYLANAAAGPITIIDTYGASSITVTTTGTPVTDCLSINAAIDGNNTLGYTHFAMRCIPANAAGGIALLSTRRFSVDSAAAAPLAINSIATALTAESNGSSSTIYTSPYGTHMLVIEPNGYFDSVATVDANMSVEFTVSTDGAQYANVDAAIVNTITSIDTAMANGTSSIGAIAVSDATGLDLDNDGTDDAVLMASNYRFFVKDATLVRTFTYDDTRIDANTTVANGNWDGNQTVRIIGVANADTNITDDNLANGNALGGANSTVAFINALRDSTTHVGAIKLEGNEDNSTFMIYYTGAFETDSTRIGKIDLQEQAAGYEGVDGYDVFTETEAYNESNYTAKGAIRKVWQVSNMVNYVEANSSGSFDGNYTYSGKELTTDARYNAIYAEDFPVSGPLFDIVTGYGKRAELIAAGQTSTTSPAYVSWKQLDASVPAEEWYDIDNQFELFWTEKEKGYWVYLDGASTNDLSFTTTGTLSGTPYSHFNNWFVGTAVTATTRNHLNHTLRIKISGLTTYGAATTNTDTFEVFANISGNWTSLQRDGTSNDFIMPLSDHETNGLSFDAGSVSIAITAAEGSGKKITTTYLLDYAKPVITGVTMSGSTATVAITNGGSGAASELQVYTGDINDSSYGTATATNWGGSVTVSADTTDANLGAMGMTFPTSFDYNATGYKDAGNWYATLADQKKQGLINDVRFVAKDSGSLYSNQYRLYYVPIYAGAGLLSSSSTTTYDSNPLVYGTTGIADATYTGVAGGENDGVQLKSAIEGSAISCAYGHQSVTLDTGVAATADLYNGTEVVGVIMWMPEYDGKPFMCTDYNGATYFGAFGVSETTQAGKITLQSVSSVVSTTVVKQ